MIPEAFSAGARVAGAVIVLGYLSGLVAGPVVAVAGGLALMTLGRALLMPPRDEFIAAGALAVTAGALGIAALRWQALDLGELRGVQAVLGPTVLVGPTEAAIASWLGAGAAIVALGLWLGSSSPSGRWERIWLAAEAFVGALAVVSVFWGPALVGDGAGEIAAGVGRWAATVGIAGLAATGIAVGAGRLGSTWRWAVLVVAGVGVVTGAGLAIGAS